MSRRRTEIVGGSVVLALSCALTVAVAAVLAAALDVSLLRGGVIVGALTVLDLADVMGKAGALAIWPKKDKP